MSCLATLLLALIVLYVGAAIAIGLIPIALGLIIIGVVAALAAIVWLWRVLYPWLVRMGRWAAQVKNIIFLALVLAVVAVGLHYITDVPVVTIPLVRIQLPVTAIVFGLLFLFLFFLGLVVWVVRLWRRGWPTVRDFFWDIGFRIVALLWRILVGIPLGVTWFFYHPPIRWLVATFLFFFRRISAGVAWLLCNPPLGSIMIAILFIGRVVGRVVGAILYNVPILWLVQAVVFVLRLIARPVSSAIYTIWSWWPITGIKGTLRKGITAESKSYQDYKYA
jgi:hypothetical protein